MKSLVVFLLIFYCGYSFSQTADHTYLRMVGDTEFNHETDKPDFFICDSTKIGQYFNFGDGGLQYKGEKITLDQQILSKYDTTNIPKQSGMIRIRFIVNCKGETDRFRLLEADYNYQQKVFHPSITNQLLKLTKELNGWIPYTYDYYQYLIFKIYDGKITEILP